MKPDAPKTLRDILEQAAKSSDFRQFSPSAEDDRIRISYYSSLVDAEKINRYLIAKIQQHDDDIRRLADIQNRIPFDEAQITEDTSEVESKLVKGYVILQIASEDPAFLIVNINQTEQGHRQSNETENEFSVVGPKIGFVENIHVNVHLLRQQIAVTRLVIEEVSVGSLSNTKVMIAYLDGVTNPQHIETMKQWLGKIDFEVVFDTSILDQIISDHTNSPFPLYLSTERVDRVAYAITSGQVAVFADGSPYVFTGPSTFLDFFVSPEDYYLPWIIGSFFRIVRILSVIFSIFVTPVYVAVLTYHFEVIPENILEPLIMSRTHVPLPPVLEALFLEVTIELLREAGARLPTKIGQTLGIVGGIVIGQATVEAALASSILLIIVALSALASFTTPIFKMANTIRLLRFPLILLAGLWGGLGIVAGLFLLLGHLLRLKSLGTPYLLPLFPLRTGNFGDSFVRRSYRYITNRNIYLRPLDSKRYTPSEDKEDIEYE